MSGFSFGTGAAGGGFSFGGPATTTATTQPTTTGGSGKITDQISTVPSSSRASREIP